MPIKILHIDEQCTGCGACVSTCAKGALSLKYDKEGFYYPSLDKDKCIDCKQCEKTCHVLCNRKSGDNIVKDYTPYMLKASDRSIVMQSSSGGVFSLLSAKVLDEDGVVYGARYNYELERLEHCSTDNCSIEELRKSKYIESYLGDVFTDVRKQLQNGRKVLFCGTPCQVKGLKKYLETKKTNTEKLITVRFICHGVPANKFFTEYKHWKEKNVGSKITHIDFRPKTRGWSQSNIVLKFANDKVIDEAYRENYYYYYFQINNSLRKSCYHCNLLEESFSDYTIADFWGVFKYTPGTREEEGISLVLAHTALAKEQLQQLNCTIKKLPQSAVEYIYKDARAKSDIYKLREKTMSEILQVGYMNHAIKKLRKDILIYKFKTRTVTILKKLGIWKLIKK
jgi:coenzyme F420-reducing hydrogenase beta subunit